MFAELTLLVAAALVGPLLAAPRRSLVPVVVGELAAGALIGRTGFAMIDPTHSILPATYSIGFAMLMMTAGTHVDIRSPVIRAGAARGAVAFAVALGVALPVGLAVGLVIGTSYGVLLVVLLAGSSAAIAFPILEERGLQGPTIAFLTAWVAIADLVTVVLMPLSLTGPSSLIAALLGDAAVVAVGVLVMLVAVRLRGHRLVTDGIAKSKRKGWGLQLRLSILLLLVLAAIAEGIGGSILVAGFLAGMVLIRIGQTDRLALQISGVANGFFVPLFFVLLGAELDLRALVSEPRAIAFAVAMAAAAIGVHLVAAMVVGRRNRVASGLAASAQLGLPAAAAALAISAHAASPAYAAALVAAGCLTLAPATIGAVRLGGGAKRGARAADGASA